MPSTTDQNYEQLSYRAPSGSQWNGRTQGLIGDAVATRQLTMDDAGKICQFDRAAGVVYTLPAPVVGAEFEFDTTVTATSNSHKVITSTAAQFILGTIQMLTAGSATTFAAAANGTTHVAITSNGTTTGGAISGRFKLTCISATQWMITGFLTGSGTLATPFTTS